MGTWEQRLLSCRDWLDYGSPPNTATTNKHKHKHTNQAKFYTNISWPNSTHFVLKLKLSVTWQSFPFYFWIYRENSVFILKLKCTQKYSNLCANMSEYLLNAV